jgi:uncharacterized repeat protein (TIGR03803 family)
MLLAALEAGMKNAFLCAAVVILSYGFALGQATEKLLYSFGPPPDAEYGGGSPLVSDNTGNLYGVATGGGSQNGGAVFELSPNGDGSWSETLLYGFCPYNQNCPDGSAPEGLTIDSQGNLFGITGGGGTYDRGTAFEISPPSAPGGVWSYLVLYSFDDQETYSSIALTLDKFGNLYGTSYVGGPSDAGYIWELSPSASGWTETILYSFCALLPTCADGANPATGVAFDKMGNLYGTTMYGGTKVGKLGGGGTMYELSPGPNGWTERVLASFPYLRGWPSLLGLPSVDPAGNAYTTFTVLADGDPIFDGTVVRVKRDGVMKAFYFNGSDGSTPLTGVIVDPKRRLLYGTVEISGSNPCGGVFQINASGQESLLYDFCQYPGDAAAPGGLLEDASGNLYGSTYNGGAYGYGAVFEITP